MPRLFRELGGFSGQAKHGADWRTCPMINIGEIPDAVNRPKLTFSPRHKLLTDRMLLFGGAFWPFGLVVRGRVQLVLVDL